MREDEETPGTRVDGADASRPPRRLAREERTIATMIGMYCRDLHGNRPRGPEGLCEECAELLAYARARLARCPYGIEKPTCAQCTTHCYRPAMREQVRAVMRHAGPRMVMEHPLLAAAHLKDGRRKTPSR